MSDLTNKNSNELNDFQRSMGNQDMNASINQDNAAINNQNAYSEEVDAFYRSEIKRDWSLFERVTNQGFFRKVQAQKSQMLHETGKYRLAFYKQLLDTRITILRERCESGVKAMKAFCRQQRASFILEQMEILQERVIQSEEVFLKMIRRKYEMLENVKDIPTLYEKYEQVIYRAEERHLKVLDTLLNDFEKLVNEQISES